METTHRSHDPRAAAEHHRWLMRQAERTRSGDVQAVLNLGAAVLMHASLEPTHLQRVLRLVDPWVVRELECEHERLEEDLELLQELNDSDPQAQDVGLLADAVLARLRAHLERDERTLYRPLYRLLEVEASAQEPETGS